MFEVLHTHIKHKQGIIEVPTTVYELGDKRNIIHPLTKLSRLYTICFPKRLQDRSKYSPRTATPKWARVLQSLS